MIKGILGKKIGMTQIFNTDGVVTPVTVIQAGPCWITQIKNEETDGYNAIQIGFEEVGADTDDQQKRARKIERRVTKAERGHLGLLESTDERQRKTLTNAVPAVRHLREFEIDDLSGIEEGQLITVDVFRTGEKVDIVGTSKGKGFAGTIKRHNFRRQPKTHGASDRTRAPGSIGSTSTPGRVLKGLKMAGRMGGERVTAQNLEIAVVDAERNLLAVKGSVPGAKGGLVMIRPTVKKQ
jgi:large subunit ribosomal protein L3